MGEASRVKQDHLLCTLPFAEPKAILDRIRTRYPELKVTYINLGPENAFSREHGVPDEIWQDVTILITLSALPPSGKDCPNLELIQFFSAGINHVATHPIYTSTKIPLTTSSGIHGPQISEWVLMTLLVSSHHYHLLHSWQLDHAWGKKGPEATRLRTVHDAVGQRLGVLGYGSIGRQVARVAQAMGMDVIAYTASPRPTAASKKDTGFIVAGTGDPDGTIPSAWYSGLDTKSLHHFLSQNIDLLLVSVPLTKETTHLLSAPEFTILASRNAFISNISRGQILNQPDLIAALNAYHLDSEPAHGQVRKGLRGAALDVTDPEPLPPDDKLWDTPNVIITPHISGLGTAYAHRCFEILEGNLERRERGEGLMNVVDRSRGY